MFIKHPISLFVNINFPLSKTLFYKLQHSDSFQGDQKSPTAIFGLTPAANAYRLVKEILCGYAQAPECTACLK